MKLRRILLIIGFLVAVAAGAGATYLVLTAPNDIKADALLREARADLNKGKRLDARRILLRIVKEHPRTDAASAAIYALFGMELESPETIPQQLLRQQHLLDQLAKNQTEIAKRLQTLEQSRKEEMQTLETMQKAIDALQKPAPKPSTKKKSTTSRRHR